MEEKNNKETISLLDLLSDSESAVSDIVLAPRKKKVKRRYRSGVSIRETRGDPCGCGRSQTKTVALWLAAILITFWLLVLSWLVVIFYSDIRRMDAKVRAGKFVQLYHKLIQRRSAGARPFLVNASTGPFSLELKKMCALWKLVYNIESDVEPPEAVDEQRLLNFKLKIPAMKSAYE